RHVQRCGACVIILATLNVDIRPSLNESVYCSHLIPDRSRVQGRAAVRVMGIHVHSVPNQRLHDPNMPTTSSQTQRRKRLVLPVPQARVSTGRQESLNGR
ncbi:unnamed protein product, partial [Ectocarpus sp. 8 AP-2014]